MSIAGCIQDRVRHYPPHAVYTDDTFRRKWGKLNDSQTIAYTLAFNDHKSGRLSFSEDHVFAEFQPYKINVENKFFYFTVRHGTWFIFHDRQYHQIQQIAPYDVEEQDRILSQILPNANFNSENVGLQVGVTTKELTAQTNN